MNPLFGTDILNGISVCLYLSCNLGFASQTLLTEKSQFTVTGDRSFSVVAPNYGTAGYPTSVKQMNCSVSADHLRLTILGKPFVSKLWNECCSLCITITITITILCQEYNYVNMLTYHLRTFIHDLSFFNNCLFIFVYLLSPIVSLF